MSSDAQNPYASPVTDAELVASGDKIALRRMGDVLVVPTGTGFPDRCVKCNSPAQGYRLKRVYTWHHPAWYLLLLFNLLIYVIVALIVRKNATLHVGLCPRHRARRRNAIVVAWLLVLVAVGCFVVGVAFEQYVWMIPVGAVVFLGAALWGLIGARVLNPKGIDANEGWFKGACREFLADIENR